MGEIKYKNYRDYLMKEPLNAITIGYMEVTKNQKEESKKRIEEVQKIVNGRIKSNKNICSK